MLTPLFTVVLLRGPAKEVSWNKPIVFLRVAPFVQVQAKTIGGEG